jgi:hypothetical protein
MSEHEEKADRLEDEADALQRQSERLGEDIAGAREDWEHKQRDESVPGAVGEPRSDREMPPPEPDETD